MPSSDLKTPDQIKKMHELGATLAQMMKEISSSAVEGVSPKDLDNLAEDLCKKYKVNPSCRGYAGYPAALCVSINDQAVHCIPTDRKFVSGDIVTIDMVIDKDGWFVDHAVTVGIGQIDSKARALIDTTKRARSLAIKEVKLGNATGDIGYMMEKVATEQGFNVLKNMIGHGIGRTMHEYPPVPCYGNRGEGAKLLEGMVLTVEPMLVEGDPNIITSREDGWSTWTPDGGRFAIFEHTVAVTKNGPLILTE